MSFLYKNPISSIQVNGTQTVPRNNTYGTTFSVNNTGGYMEVFSLSDLYYIIPSGTTGSIEYSGNTIPIEFTKGTGVAWSPNVITLASDNISSGRRRLGMLVYVYEEDQVYQYYINNYETLFNAATASTGCAQVSNFGTTINNKTAAGQSFINAWTGNTIEDVSGATHTTAVWRKFTTGSSSGGTSGAYLPLSGGTVSGGTIFQSGLTANTISATTYQNLPTDVYVTGGTYTNGEITFLNNTGGTFTVTGLPIGGPGGQVYYLNLSNSQPPYQEFSPSGTTNSQQITAVTINNGVTSTITSFQTPTGYPNASLIPAGYWSFYLHSFKQNSNASFNIFCEVYLRTTGGTETLLVTTDPTPVTTNSPNPSMQLTDGYYSGSSINTTDRIVVKVRATNTGNQSHSITLVTEGTQHYSYGITPFSNNIDLPSVLYITGIGINSTVRCGVNNTAKGDYGASLGGSGNTASGNYSFVGGGGGNTASGTYSIIGGGTSNTSSGNYSFVGGGGSNTSSNYFSTIGGGGFHTSSGFYSTVGGGRCNTSSNYNSTVSGGYCNTSSSKYSTIGGGYKNNSTGLNSTVGGGVGNTASGNYSTVGGGSANIASGNTSSVVGGYCNTTSGSYSFVGGGTLNTSSGYYSFIGGGNQNTISGYPSFGPQFSTILNGCLNSISGTAKMSNSVIIGGMNNFVSDSFIGVFGCNIVASCPNTFYTNDFCSCGSIYSSALSSGQAVCSSTNGLLTNYTPVSPVIIQGSCTTSSIRCGVGNNATADFSASLAGTGNTASGLASVVVGGALNNTYSTYSFVGGGIANKSCGSSASVVGGGLNTSCCSYSFIGGGLQNITSGVTSSVVGGGKNTAGGNCSFIGGGTLNIITSGGSSSFIGTGRGNTVSGSYGMALGGSGNTVSGSFSSAIGCGLNATANCTLYTNNIITGGLSANTISATTYNNLPVSGLTQGTNITITNNGSGNYTISSTGGGGTFTGGTVSGATIFTGGLSANTISATTATIRKITGGSGNTNSGTYSFIGGGCLNVSSGNTSTIAGGLCNIAGGAYSFIGGGTGNTMTASTSCFSSISSGVRNNVCCSYSFIGGGSGNTIAGNFGFIGGGCGNYLSVPIGQFIGGGFKNSVAGGCSTILNGYCNINNGTNSIIGGGFCNLIPCGTGNFIATGFCNKTDSSYSFIGNGVLNCHTSSQYYPNDRSVIVGGYQNTTSSSYYGSGGNFIGAGQSNSTYGNCNVIVGGQSNVSNGNYSFVGGGSNNNIGSINSNSFIGGGDQNIINGGFYIGIPSGWKNCIQNQVGGYIYTSVIGGGGCNLITSIGSSSQTSHSTISGGYCNRIYDTTGAILGGGNNTISGTSGTLAVYSSIGGGLCNSARCSYSFIGGGTRNIVSGQYSGILGGSGNTVTGNYSFAIGCGLNATSACTLYTNNIITGTISATTMSATTISATTISAVTISSRGGNIVTKISSGVDSSGNTTTGSYQLVQSVLIPANTITTGDIVLFKARYRKVGVNAAANYRISVNTTLNLTGAQIVGQFNSGLTILYTDLSRTAAVKGGTTEVFNTSITNVQDDVNTSTSAVTTLTIDWTVNQFVMYSILNSSASDTTFVSYYSINEI